MKINTPFAYILGTVLMLSAFSLDAQTKLGELRGKITDAQSQEDIPFANIILSNYEGQMVAGVSSNVDGIYKISNLNAGFYQVKVTYLGYANTLLDSVEIVASIAQTLNLSIQPESQELMEVVVLRAEPLIQKAKSSKVTTSESIQKMAVRDIRSIASPTAGVSTERDATLVRGIRGKDAVYFIDGVKVRGSINVPNSRVVNSSILKGQSHSSVVYNFRSPDHHWEVVPSPKRQSSEERYQGENYKHIPENEFLGTFSEPLSTFGADVDVASYANIRRMLNEGYWPHPDAVRLEELINYFSYDLEEPDSDLPFGLTIDQRPCDWNPKHQLLRIGMQTEEVETADLAPSNLVFLIDVSGSMNSYDKLPLLKNAMRILVKNLKDEDRVAIVVYASATGLVLESTPASDKNKILEAIDRLSAGGSTAGGAGIKLAYKTAREHFDEDYNNRVILATDGDFNVGVSSEEGLIKLIEKERESGVFLSVLGFGTGNYQDAKMEQLADHGNGNYAYIDGLMEAQKVLSHEMGATMHVVAKDTKFQIEFNPQKVSAYRLIGYENRILEAEDFDDDKKDAGDIGAGHSVTVVYEIIPRIEEDDALWTDEPKLRYQDQQLSETAYGDELAHLKIRYKEPQAKKSELSIYPIKAKKSKDSDFAFLSAVIQYGLVLRRSEFAGTASLDQAIALAEDNLGDDPNGYRREFVKLCKLAKDLKPEEETEGYGALD